MNPNKRSIQANRTSYCPPASFFFSFLLLLSLSIQIDLAGRSVFPARGFAKVLTKEEATQRLQSYRSFIVRDLNKTKFHNAYAFRFRMRHMPRRGDEFSRTGTIYGLSPGHGLSRIELDSNNSVFKKFLLENGQKPEAWIFLPKQEKSILMTDEKLFQPIFAGMNQSPFDILMPFVFWEAKYTKSGKVAGRPSHLYSFIPPKWVRDEKADLSEIIMAIDDSYEAPLRIEIFSRSNVPERTIILNSMKKISNHWIVKSIDCKNRVDRSNTRFEVTSAALNLDLDPSLFSPDGLLNTPVIPEDAFISTK